MLQFNWSYIRLVLLLVLAVFLFAFSSIRNKDREIRDIKVEFKGDNNLYISRNDVNKFFVQNEDNAKNIAKDMLDLMRLESGLNANAMIKKAQVYVAVNGTLKAEIEQKEPLARVHTNVSYYIDNDGLYMPLSLNYSARVPLVTGYVEKNNLKNVFKVAKKIKEDSFLKTNVTEIHQSEKGIVSLKLRKCIFTVQLGNTNLLDKKINNLKAFYQKNLKDKTLNRYSKVNLQFDNQVVCTKN